MTKINSQMSEWSKPCSWWSYKFGRAKIYISIYCTTSAICTGLLSSSGVDHDVSYGTGHDINTSQWNHKSQTYRHNGTDRIYRVLWGLRVRVSESLLWIFTHSVRYGWGLGPQKTMALDHLLRVNNSLLAACVVYELLYSRYCHHLLPFQCNMFDGNFISCHIRGIHLHEQILIFASPPKWCSASRFCGLVQYGISVRNSSVLACAKFQKRCGN